MSAVAVMKPDEKQPEAPKKSLVTKLAEVMGEVERVAKRGRNDFHKYDYATEADIAAGVRSGMAERHLIIIPDVQETTFTKIPTKNGEQSLCTMKVKFTVKDGDSNEELSFTMMGQGQDAGDKATYKAMTGAEKYALLKLFLIPTGDDPEADSHERSTAAPQHRYPPKRAEPKRQESDVPALEFSKKLKGIPLAEFDSATLTSEIEYRKKALATGAGDNKAVIERDLAKLTAELAGRMAGK